MKSVFTQVVVALSVLGLAIVARATPLPGETDTETSTSYTANNSIITANNSTDLLLNLPVTLTAGLTITTSAGGSFTAGQPFPNPPYASGAVDGLNSHTSVASAINDGVGGNNTNASDYEPGDVVALNTASLNADPTFTFNLTGKNAAGFTLTGVQSFYAYEGPDDAAANQNYIISYSTVAAPNTFIQLAHVDYEPFTSISGSEASTEVSLTTATFGTITNVADIQFEMLPDAGASGLHGEVMQELDVFGTAVPEPGTWAMLLGGVAVLGAVLRFRRLRA